MSLPSSSAWAAYQAGFTEIERVARLTEGFVLVPVQVVGPDVARALADFLRDRGRSVTVIEPETEHDWETLAPTLLETEKAPEGVVVVIGGRDLPEGVYKGLRLLNQRRDSIVGHIDRPLLWCGPASFLSLTWERAPDFWSVRAVDRKLEPSQVYDEVSREVEPSSSRDLLESAFEQGDFASAARIASHAIDEDLAQGRAEEAAHVAEDALARLPETHLAERAELLLRLSEVASTRGQVGDALTILRRLEALDLPAELSRRVTLSLGLLLQDDDPEASEGYYERALESASEAKDHEVEARAELGLARTEALRGGPAEEVLRGIQRARALAEKSDNRGDLEATALATEAQVTALLHDRRKAEQLLKRAEETVAPGQRISPQRAQALADATRDIAHGPRKKAPKTPALGEPSAAAKVAAPEAPSPSAPAKETTPSPSLLGGPRPAEAAGAPTSPPSPLPAPPQPSAEQDDVGPTSKVATRTLPTSLVVGLATATVLLAVWYSVTGAPPAPLVAQHGVSKATRSLPAALTVSRAAAPPPDAALLAASIEAAKDASDDVAWARLAVLVYAAEGGVTLRDLPSRVTSATFSPDGGSVLMTSEKGPATLSRVETGAPSATLQSGRAIVSGSFSPDGARVLTTDDAGLLVTWDTLTGERVAEFKGAPLAPQSVPIEASFSPDGTKILSVSGGEARLFRADGSLLVTLRPRKGYVTVARFSPNGTKLLLASDEGAVRLLPITRDGVLVAACALVGRSDPEAAARVCEP